MFCILPQFLKVMNNYVCPDTAKVALRSHFCSEAQVLYPYFLPYPTSCMNVSLLCILENEQQNTPLAGKVNKEANLHAMEGV